jgi:ClpX C4-type zinc finger
VSSWKRSPYHATVPDPSDFNDVVCSFCGRHNREVRVVTNDAGLVVCQVCVAKCADILDAEVAIDPPPGGWSARWPLKS